MMHDPNEPPPNMPPSMEAFLEMLFEYQELHPGKLPANCVELTWWLKRRGQGDALTDDQAIDMLGLMGPTFEEAGITWEPDEDGIESELVDLEEVASELVGPEYTEFVTAILARDPDTGVIVEVLFPAEMGMAPFTRQLSKAEARKVMGSGFFGG